MNGTLFWLRHPNEELNLTDYPSDNEYLNKKEMLDYYDKTIENIDCFFEELNEIGIYNSHNFYDKISNFDVVIMQIRHVQNHIGHCNELLIQNNIEPVHWRSYRG